MNKFEFIVRVNNPPFNFATRSYDIHQVQRKGVELRKGTPKNGVKGCGCGGGGGGRNNPSGLSSKCATVRPRKRRAGCFQVL